ncbi:MAG TPA: AsmA family protein, partial [Devosia sp.]|nr:AsmA family protein [Devosia sp.]
MNRIYIIVGIFAIVVLGGAFLAPRFIEWSDYRGRMEVLASQMLGTPVTIRGKIDFALLPQPRLNLEDVLVGSPEEPAATVDRVVAEFSLMDFLRDNYHLTHLLLQGPVVDFTIDDNGLFSSGVVLETGSTAIGLGPTNIADGTLRLMDRRSGGNHVVEQFDGELKLTSFNGPIQLQGAANYGGERYSFRFSSAAPDAVGNARVSAYLQGANYSISSEGSLTPGVAPKYDGAVTYRQKPAIIAGTPADGIRGDLVLESKLTASTDRIVLTGYTLQPDENRAGTRLTGAASVQLGRQASFDAVVSGGVFALPPRDANEDVSQQPYEIVRLLGELPAPMVPPMAGRIGIDLAEIGLRGFSLRDMRVDARTDGESWQIENFSAQLPGNTRVSATGTLGNEQERPVFRGSFKVNSARLEGLAQLWRKPASDNPLFGQPGSLEGRVLLNGDALGISNGALTLAGGVHAVELRVGFGEERRLDVMGHFDELGAQGSAMLAALLPVIEADPLFGVSFPDGSFSLTGKSAQILGIDGTDLAAEGQWSPGQLSLSRLFADDWGGAHIDAAMKAGGTLAQPALSGSGRVKVASPSAPALAALYDMLQTPQSWRDYLALSHSSDVLIDLLPADDLGKQLLTIAGQMGAGDLNLRAEIADGINNFSDGQMRVTAGLEGPDAFKLTQQLGFGDAEVFAD